MATPVPDPMENLQRAWAELTTIMRMSNETIFRSKQITMDKIRNGEYIGHLNKISTNAEGLGYKIRVHRRCAFKVSGNAHGGVRIHPSGARTPSAILS